MKNNSSLSNKKLFGVSGEVADAIAHAFGRLHYIQRGRFGSQNGLHLFDRTGRFRQASLIDDSWQVHSTAWAQGKLPNVVVSIALKKLGGNYSESEILDAVRLSWAALQHMNHRNEKTLNTQIEIESPSVAKKGDSKVKVYRKTISLKFD